MSRLLLLSGGIDSASVAAWLRPEECLFIDYGQRAASGERQASSRVAAALRLPWAEFAVDCHRLGGGLMAGQPARSLAPTVEWWPFRNQLLATLAASWAVTESLDEVLLGCVSSDAERHRDASPWFFEQLDALTSGQEGAVHVRAPALSMTTEDLISTSGIARSVLGGTFSCHTSGTSCGDCPGCWKRAQVFEAIR